MAELMITKHDKCPECGNKLSIDEGGAYQPATYWEPAEEGYPPTLYCEKCEWEADPDEVDWTNKPTPEQRKEIDRLDLEIWGIEKKLRKQRQPVTVESLFEGAPEGDFDWEGEPESAIYKCGDSDCESGWHRDSEVIRMGRKNGKTWFEVLRDSNAGDGDYQPLAGWDEREGDTITDDVLEYLTETLCSRTEDIIIGDLKYALHVAETGEDPLGEWLHGTPSPEEAIQYVKKAIERYL